MLHFSVLRCLLTLDNTLMPLLCHLTKNSHVYKTTYSNTMKSVYRFNSVLSVATLQKLTRSSKFHVEIQGTQNSQNSSGKEQCWWTHISWFQNLVQSYNNQSSVLLPKRWRYRPVEYNWDFRNKPMYQLINWFLTRVPRQRWKRMISNPLLYAKMNWKLIT